MEQIIIHGDCLEEMKNIKDKSINMILCDLPYGTTECKWDSKIDLDKLWFEYRRIIKDNGVICLFGNGYFSFELLKGGADLFKYKYVWIKTNSTMFVHSKNRPLVKHEDILVFSKAPMGHKSLLREKRMPYNPQGLVLYNKKIKKGKGRFGTVIGNRPSHKDEVLREFTNYPCDVLEYPENIGNKVHTCQKPIELCKFLIKTYTDENDIVLDNCAGSFSTLVACQETNRGGIGIEIEEKYVNIGKDRLNQKTLFNSSPPVQTSNSTSLTSAKQKGFNKDLTENQK